MNARDIESLRAFYVGNRQQLFTYAVSITGNRETAEDVIHGVFEKLLRATGLPADLRPYAFRSVRNAALDSWRRTRIRTDSVFEVAAAMDADASGTPAASPADELAPFLQQLSPDEREAIVLRIHGGLTFKEVAELRGVPLPTVASWYRRGLERLRAMLNKES